MTKQEIYNMYLDFLLLAFPSAHFNIAKTLNYEKYYTPEEIGEIFEILHNSNTVSPIHPCTRLEAIYIKETEMIYD